MTARWRLTGLEPAEHDIQVGLCRTLAIEIAAPGRLSPQGVTWFCIDHANFAGQPGARYGRGIVAGIPDMLLLYRGCAYFIELKRRGSAAVLSDAQQWLLPVLAAAGSRIGIAQSVEEALALLDAWDIPRRRIIRGAA